MLALWHHPAVRDLYWSINSSSLITTPRITHWQDQGEFFTEHCHQLDQDPSPLLTWLKQRLPNNRTPRLGHYFESLWHYYFTHHPEYQLVAHNLQIQSSTQLTLGELDLIVKDIPRDCVMHIELAVKFYLALPHIYHHDHPLQDNFKAFVGPGLKDSLTQKYHHTFAHQLPLSLKPEFKSHGIQIDERHGVFKGRLFLPRNEATLPENNIWLNETQLGQLPAQHDYLRLERSQWFSSIPEDSNLLTRDDLVLKLENTFKHPIQLASYDKATGEEKHRLFVVPKDWEAQAYHAFSFD